MSDQLSLFGDDHLTRMAFYENLEKFDLEAATKSLEKWQRTFNPPDDLPQKIEALRYLLQQINIRGKSFTQYLAQLLKTWQKQPELQPLKKEGPYLTKGLYYALYSQLDKQSIDFIDEELQVHPAEVLIAQCDFQGALRILRNYFQRYGEHPFLRELQAFALWETGQKRQAMVDYTFAVFADPFALQETYLRARFFRKKLNLLRHQLQDEAKARVRLAFELWREGQTYIEGTHPSFEEFIKARIRTLAQKPNDPNARLLHFNALLFLAESERLRAYPNRPGTAFENLSAEMRALSYEHHTLYIETLKSFRNI